MKQITIKSKLKNGEMRRTTIDTPRTYTELESMCEMVHGTSNRRGYKDSFTIMYADDEGDNITMTTDSDLAEAIRVSATTGGILRLLLVPAFSKNRKKARPVARPPTPTPAVVTTAALSADDFVRVEEPAVCAEAEADNEEEQHRLGVLRDATHVAEQAIVRANAAAQRANAAVQEAIEQSKRSISAMFCAEESSVDSNALARANAAVQQSRQIVRDAVDKADAHSEPLDVDVSAGPLRGIFVEPQSEPPLAEPVVDVEEFVVVKQPADVAKNSFERNLETLHAMGFTDRAENIRVLVKNKNVLYNAIQEFVGSN